MTTPEQRAAFLKALQQLPTLQANPGMRGMSDLMGGASRGWRVARRFGSVQTATGDWLVVTSKVLLDPPAWYVAERELPVPTVLDSLTSIGRAYLFAVFVRLARWVAKD